MKAFVMQEIDESGSRTKPVPQPGPNDAIMRTTRAPHLHLGLAYGPRRDRAAR